MCQGLHLFCPEPILLNKERLHVSSESVCHSVTFPSVIFLLVAKGLTFGQTVGLTKNKTNLISSSFKRCFLSRINYSDSLTHAQFCRHRVFAIF